MSDSVSLNLDNSQILSKALKNNISQNIGLKQCSDRKDIVLLSQWYE
jgi:hypothetical protein